MTIADTSIQDKGFLGRVGEWFVRVPKGFLFLLALVLASSGGLGVGILIGKEGAGSEDTLWIEQLPLEVRSAGEGRGVSTPDPAPTQAAAAITALASSTLPAGGEVVASKTGEVYYLPWCGSAKRITPEKLVTFPSRAAAEAAGYRAAKNCKGL